MKALKIILAALLIAVSALYLWANLSTRISGTDEPPVLSGDRDRIEISVRGDQAALLAGVTAQDSQDGDLTDQILISGVSKLMADNTAKVSYLVFDSDNNTAAYTRTVHYTDYQHPRFQIVQPLIYHRDDKIVLLDRIQVSDVIDGDITALVRISEVTETGRPNEMLATLLVTNSMGDTVRMELPIIVYEDRSPNAEIRLAQHLLYLPVGTAFDARSQLLSVTLPDGTQADPANVAVSGHVDTAVPGIYHIRYRFGQNITQNNSQSQITGLDILTVVVE